MEQINIGVLHYKTIDKTIECITSIQTTEPSAVIYIIDNYSNDGSLECLQRKYADIPNISFICLKENIGFARANNHCMRLLREKGESCVILTNNDIVFKNNSIKQLLSSLQSADAILSAPKVLDPNGQVMDTVLPYRNNSIWDYLFNRIKDKTNKNRTPFAESCDDVSMIETFSGCCFACDLEKMADIDYFDETTFLYFEEPILSAKIKKAGYTMCYVPSAEVSHYHGATTSSLNLKANAHKLFSQMYYFEEYLNVNKYVLMLLVRIKRYIDFKRYRSKDLYDDETRILNHIKLKFKLN